MSNKTGHMRNLIFSINLTADGCCDHTKGIADVVIHEYFADLMRSADTLVYGRKTYQLMVPFWPDMAKTQSGQTKAWNDFALAFDAVEKIAVFSRTLDKAESKKTQIFRGNLEDEIRKLKQQPGKNILLGGVDFPSQLVHTGLIDEYRLVFHPILAGEGTRLFQGISLRESVPLKLVESKVLGTGFVALRYLKN
jgi:dihydrofolate reductase